MKRLLIISAAVILLAGCTPKPSYTPLQKAVVDYVAESVGPDAKLSFNSIEVADSLTYGQLYEQRVKAFRVKLDQDIKFVNRYKSKKMPVNADKHQKSVEKDKTILSALEKMDISDIADNIVCYDMVFSGKADSPSQTTVFEEFYAAVTPDGKILATNDSKKGLHKGFGKYLPGYTEILRSVGGEDDEK